MLDILILGLLVVLFSSICSKRASRRLRLWTLAWLLAELQFTGQLAHPFLPYLHNFDLNLDLSALIGCGICFLLSASPISEGRLARMAAWLIGISTLFYANYVLLDGPQAWPLYAATAVGAIGGTSLAWSIYRRRIRLLAFVTLTFVAGELWTFSAILHHHPKQGLAAPLAEIFLTFASLYWFDFRRFSPGVLTTVIGLASWALVFPVSLLSGYSTPGAAAGLWHVPIYFVAFGMILTLLEDEIFAAGRASEHYRLLFVDSPHPMWIHDLETRRFLRVNDAAVKHYGYSRQEFFSMTLDDLLPSEDIETVLRETAKADSFTLSGSWQHRKKDGSEIQVDMAAHLVEFHGRSCRFVLVQDVTERQRLHRELVHQAHHDSLTGLPNRLLLEDRMQQAFAQAARHGQRAAVVCIDLDRFKHVNDTFGHSAGDRCLQQVAERIAKRLRAADTVARTGGEEFILVLGELENVRDAAVVAQQLLASIREPIEADGRLLQISASLGIAVYPDDGIDSSALWRAADRAMYRAKHHGGGRVQFVSSLPSRSRSSGEEAGELERAMRRMLDEGGFELHYQPIYSTGGNFCGLEALLRLNHPQLGMIGPGRLMPIAEESGLIAPLTSWMLGETCRQGAEWRRQGLEPLRIGLNISPLQLMRLDFSPELMRTLSQHELDPHLLEVGVTETGVMGNFQEVAGQMRGLATLGVRVAIEDFGTGHLSLNHLHQLPSGTLKVDRSFVEQISAANGTYSIVQAILALGHSLGFEVGAKGVERAGQVENLCAMGCDFLQGQLFAPPMPAARVPGYLTPHAGRIGPARAGMQALERSFRR